MPKFVRNICSIVGFLLLFWNLASQTLAPVFHSLPSEIGLNNGSVIDVLQDNRGFLWMATWSGLVKYDGYSVKVYKQEADNSNGLKSNKISNIFEDSRGNLWIGTNYTGFYKYDRKTDRFIQFCKKNNNPNSLSNDNVEAILEDQEGYLWIGTENGLNRFDPDNNTFQHFHHDPRDIRSISHNYVYSLARTSDGNLWIGTEAGLNRLVKSNRQFHFAHYELSDPGNNPDDYLAHNFIFRIIPSGNDPKALWIATSIGLKKFTYDRETFEATSLKSFLHESGNPGSLSNRFVADVYEESKDKVWVATYNGLNLLNEKTGKIRHFYADKRQPYGIGNNTLHCLYTDRFGILWIGTSKGVNKLHLKAKPFQSLHFAVTDNSNSDIITSMALSGNGAGMWLGSKGGGLIYLPLGNSGTSLPVIRSYRISPPRIADLAGFISDLILDKNGSLWLSTHGAGLIRIKEKDIPPAGGVLSNLVQYGKSNVLADDYIVSLAQSRDGSIWYGYWDIGIGRFDPLTAKFHQYRFSSGMELNFGDFPVVHLFETLENGNSFLWVGTRGGGVYKLRFDAKSDKLSLVQQYKSNGRDGSLSSNFINCFYLDATNAMWIGTENGLNKLDLNTGEIKWCLEKDGLINGIVQSVAGDKSGNIWVSTQKGISRITITSNSFKIKNFDAHDGLQDNYFNDDAALNTPDGRLVFGGINGINIFKPEDVKPNQAPPMVAITGLRLSNKPVPVGRMSDGRTVLPESITEISKIRFSHLDDVITFDFVGLQFAEPQKLQYAYMLEGFDDDWVYSDARQRFAHFTNLPYRDFKFKVKVANSDGVWSEPVSLNLLISPPFWLTRWAFIVYMLVLVGLFYGLWRITHFRAELKNQLAMERMEHEKSEELNQMKLQFFTNVSHELRTPLTLILSPLEQLIQSREGDRRQHYLFTRMHFNANRLLNMINQLLDIRKSEAGLLKIKVSEENVVQFAREVALSFKILATQRHIHFRFHSSSEEIKVWFDRDQFEKVLYNLIANAFKFTPDEGEISVSIEEDSNNSLCNIKVQDSGIGIPKEQLPYIFERFYQVERSQEWARKGGTGIGLALTKSIVEQHQGRVSVESTIGEGSVFYVKLKLGKAHFSNEQLSGSSEIRSSPLAQYLDQEEEETLASSALNTHSDSNFLDDVEEMEKPIILIVEDNLDIRSYLRENLSKSYRIQEANDGVEGLEIASHHPPDLVIADVAMPRMDGIEMCRNLKRNIATSHIPLILLTARTSLIFKLDGFESGADEYITKPFNFKLLEARIRNLIETRRRLREKYAQTLNLNPSDIVMHSIDEAFINKMKETVEKHMDDSSFSVDHLASELCMSRMQLYRKLKSMFNKSPNEVIRTIRLRRAAQLLEAGQYNVSEVTYMVGYNDLKSFREQFKKEFGMNPSAYENNNN